MLPRLTIRRATREDIEAFSSQPNKPTLKAWVGEVDGEIIGIGGLAFAHGRWFAFCDVTEEARKYKIGIMRLAKHIMADAQAQGIRYIYADADKNEPKAVAWMTSLGFEIDPRSNRYYRWKAK